MRLAQSTFADKVKACWIGKNIGGTLGAPFECRREVLDVKGFTTPPGVVLPNDDLDLQLVWLYALERFGPGAVTAETLGELWLNYITPHWNEYGIGKTNMRRGLRPPLSGDFENDWRNSNGAWIRTEIWACVTPGMPAVAAKFAIEDAKVDHGAGEGTFAAAFVAAMQSAAFVIPDIRTCIEIGLAAIPETSRMARSIRLVLASYEEGKTWLETRNAVLEQNMDLGNGWFEAPSNVCYAIIGLLYGEGDFKRSMLTAVNCGDDTDCTAATVGATLGILYGMAGIPEDWMAYVGDEIVTISLALGDRLRNPVPKTCSELTDRVVKLAPVVLYYCNWRNPQDSVELGEETQVPEQVAERLKKAAEAGTRSMLAGLQPYSMHFEEAFLHANLTLEREPWMAPGEEMGIRIQFVNDIDFENIPQPLSLRWILPQGFTVSGKADLMLRHYDAHIKGTASVQVVLRAGDQVQPRNRIILEVTIPGRHTALYASFLIFGQ